MDAGEACSPTFASVGGGAVAQSDGGACGQIGSPDPTCDLCMTQSCCSQDLACSNSQDCLTLLSCVSGCASNDTSCVTTCQGQTPNGVGPLDNLDQCLQGACSAQCLGASDAGLDGGGCGTIGSSNPTCSACMTQHCCPQEAACSNNSACVALLQCVQACAANDVTCQQTCESQHASGDSQYNDLAQCLTAVCSTQCS